MALALHLGVRGALADVVYLYDDIGRLVRVIREDGEAATYHYDAAGNLLRITRESGVPQTAAVAGVSTSVLPRSQTTGLTVAGLNLSGAVVTGSAGLQVLGVQTEVDSVVVQVRVDPTASVGPASLTIQTPYGTLTIPVTIVGGPPVVTGFAPTTALPGMVVTVTGAEFDAVTPANNSARVNEVEAQVLAVTPTALKLRVPSGAASGPISVTTLAGTATSGASLVIGTLGPARAMVPTTDLLAYWTFEEGGHDDADSFDLALQGGLGTIPAGAIGRGLAFAGNPAQIAVRPVSDAALNFEGRDFSLSVWARWTGIAGEQVLLEKCQGSVTCGPAGWTLTKLSTSTLLAHPMLDAPAVPIVAGRWYHVAVVRDGTQSRFYIDGVEVNHRFVGAQVIPPVADPLLVGERAGVQVLPMNGVLDEIGIWARALTAAEIAAIAAVRPP